jgi:hypothetical protein
MSKRSDPGRGWGGDKFGCVAVWQLRNVSRLKRRAACCTAIGQVELLFSFASMTRLLAAHRLKAQRLEQRDPG